MSKHFYFSTFLILYVLFCLAGCSGEPRPAGFPKLYPVTLKVSQEGTPLEGAFVQLQSNDPAMTWTTSGTTDANGAAVLWTYGKYKGAPAGTFKVTVMKDINEGEKEYTDALDRQDVAAAAKVKVRSFSYVEELYTSFSKTPIEIEITKSTRSLDIDAGKAVKIEKEYMK